jgi:hypothetical protein
MVEVWYALAVMNTVKDWLLHHPLLYPFILCVFAAFVSIYSQDIKSFLHHWPRAKESVRWFSQDKASRRLRLLEVLHNNSYQLLLYFATKFIQGVILWVIVAATFTIIGLITKSKTAGLQALVGICGGIFFATCQEVRGVLVQLISYDQSVAKLKERLSKLEKEGEVVN